MISKNEVALIRQLAAQVAEIAALPVQSEKRLPLAPSQCARGNPADGDD